MIMMRPTTQDNTRHEPMAANMGGGRRRSSGNGYLPSTSSDGSSIGDDLLADDQGDYDHDEVDVYDDDDDDDDYAGIDSAIKIGHGSGCTDEGGNDPAIDADVCPLSSKITLLRRQVSEIESQLANGSLKLSERHHLQEQKVEIEKTLGLLGRSEVGHVVRKGDSMDMTAGNSRPAPAPAPTPVVAAPVEMKSMDKDDHNQAPATPSATSSAPTTSTRPAPRQQPHTPHEPFSLFSSASRGPAPPPPPRGGGVQRKCSIDDIGVLQSLRGYMYKERRRSMSEGGGSTRHPASGGGGGTRHVVGSVVEGGNDTNANAAAGGGGCGGGGGQQQQQSFHASDYLFLSDENFTSPSLRSLRGITSQQSLRNLHPHNVQIMEDALDVAHQGGEEEGRKNGEYSNGGRNKKSSSRSSSTKSTRSSTTRSSKNGRRETTTTTNASSALKDMEQPDESVVNALAELSRRQMAATASTATSFTASWSHKKSSPTSSLASEVSATTASTSSPLHGGRSSITMMMSSLASEVSTTFLNNMNAEAKPCTATGGSVMGSSEELRTKGRMYSM